jgi:hypothetical protein
MLKNIILTIITIIHYIYVIFIIAAPFSNITVLLLLHAIFVPFMIFHWILNNDTCFLTIAESYIRKSINGENIGNIEDLLKKKEECFSYKLVGPIFNFKEDNENFSTFIYASVLILWGTSLYKLFKKYKDNKLTKFIDLFRL